MSRRLPSTQRRVPPLAHALSAPAADTTHYQDNPYQGTTLAISSVSRQPSRHQHHQSLHHYQHRYYDLHLQGVASKRHLDRRSFRNGPTIDIGYSEDTTDTQAYDYYRENGFRHSPLRESRGTDVTFSDESGSARLPYVEFDDESNRRYSRNTFSERSSKRQKPTNQNANNKDLRRVYPNHDAQWDQLYQEISPCNNLPVVVPPPPPQRRIPTRLSDRPQSSMSSGMTSAIVHGCGGKCQTFENVCYFFLQLVFTMSILTGLSLCIAGIVLRKSAARNLQVLVYIGAMLALVGGLLLGVQREARTSQARRRKTRLADRAPIQLDDLSVRGNQAVRSNNDDGSGSGGGRAVSCQRGIHLAQIHSSNMNRPLPYHPGSRESPPIIEEQGIPWWRRKDLEAH